MDKRKLLVYSDCYIYGGSERLMSFLVKNSVIENQYDITFSYRSHQQYDSEFVNDFHSFKGTILPLRVLSNDTISYNITKKYGRSLITKAIKVLLSLFYYSGIYFLYNSFYFIKLIRKVRPDVLHINNGGYPAARTCSQLAIIAKLLRVKNIVYQVNNQARKPTLFGFVIDPIIGRCVDSFITASKLAKANLESNAGFDSEKIQLVKNIVLPKPLNLDRKSILNEYNLSDDIIIMVQVAFLTKRKGQIFSIEALRKLRDIDKEKKYALFLIGDGEDKDYLVAKVNEYCLTEDVFFLGNRPDYNEFLAIADFVLMPSIQDEDMPLVVIESVLLHKCIISSDFAGIGEVLENNYSGVLLNPQSHSFDEEIAKTIYSLINDKEKYAKIINNVVIESNKFSEESYGRSLIKIYRSK